MVIETQILSSLSPNVVVGDPIVTSGRNRECVSLSIMQNKPNLVRRRRIANERKVL